MEIRDFFWSSLYSIIADKYFFGDRIIQMRDYYFWPVCFYGYDLGFDTD